MDNDSLRKLNIKAHFWKKETNDLYDFESNLIDEFDLTVASSGYVIALKDKSLSFINDKDLIKSKEKISKVLLRVLYKDEDFHFLSPSDLINSSEFKFIDMRNLIARAWVSIPLHSLNVISVGDTIKLGRSKLKVDRIYTKKYIEDISMMNIITNTKVQSTLITDNKDKNFSSSK